MSVLAISLFAQLFSGISLWMIWIVYFFLKAHGTPTKNFHAAFPQISELAYNENVKSLALQTLALLEPVVLLAGTLICSISKNNQRQIISL